MVACGGAARHVMDTSHDPLGVPVVYLNANSGSTIPMTDADVPGSFGDEHLAYTLADCNSDAIRGHMRGRRVVLLFAVLGGGSGTGMMRAAAECARSEGCLVVSLVGIPMQFEAERRGRAMSALPTILSMSDRTIILDIESINRIYPDIKFHHILNRVASSIAFSARCLAWMMDGPFFSTFSQRIYTMAYTTDLEPSKAVEKAAEACMFPVDPGSGKSVVMVSSAFGMAQVEAIFDTVVRSTGIVPDIVKRDDREDTKVLTYLPVQGL